MSVEVLNVASPKPNERGGSIESCKGGDKRMKIKTLNKFLLVIIILMLLIILVAEIKSAILILK